MTNLIFILIFINELATRQTEVLDETKFKICGRPNDITCIYERLKYIFGLYSLEIKGKLKRKMKHEIEAKSCETK